MTASELLATDGLKKRFGAHVAIEDLSISVRDGDIYGLLGLNGAGKTTTLRIVLGLLHPTGGSVQLFGQTVAPKDASARKHIGACVEGPAFYGTLTAAENLRLLAGLTGPLGAERVRALLHEVSLEDAADRRAKTFSLGMKQRLGIAMALAPDPKLVILDEPTNGLDPRGMHDVRALIARLNQERGITFVVSSHLLHEVESLCTRVGIVHGGRIVHEGALDELMASGRQRLRIEAEPRDTVRRVLSEHVDSGAIMEDAQGFDVAQDADAAPHLCRALIAAGADVRVLVPARRSLEELFLARTDEWPAPEQTENSAP